jgi:hypothetical protein
MLLRAVGGACFLSPSAFGAPSPMSVLLLPPPLLAAAAQSDPNVIPIMPPLQDAALYRV